MAVDLSISDYGPGADLDDVEVIDGATDENFGSDPFISYLMYDGGPFEDNFPTYEFGDPIRVLLISAVRESTTSIKLQYWGSLIISEPILLNEEGLALPESCTFLYSFLQLNHSLKRTPGLSGEARKLGRMVVIFSIESLGELQSNSPVSKTKSCDRRLAQSRWAA